MIFWSGAVLSSATKRKKKQTPLFHSKFNILNWTCQSQEEPVSKHFSFLLHDLIGKRGSSSRPGIT